MFQELKITSWNCGGFSSEFCRQNVDLINQSSSDIICIQETQLTDCRDHEECPNNGTSWKIEGRRQFYECFLKSAGIAKNYDYSAISYTEAARGLNHWKGQPYGLAILWKKDSKELRGFTCKELLNYRGKSYKRIKATYEFNAVQVTMGKMNILIINLYILSKENNQAQVLLDLVSELCVGWDNIVICGDFNFKPRDNTSGTKEMIDFKRFRDDLYDLGLNVVDVDRMDKDTITFNGHGSSSTWPDHFITSPFITENCEVQDGEEVGGSLRHAHYPLTLTFTPKLKGNSAKGRRTTETRAGEMYKWDVVLLELLFLGMKPSPHFSQQMFERSIVFKFQPISVEDVSKKLEYSTTYFRNRFDFLYSSLRAKCVMDMGVLPTGDKLVLELEFKGTSSLFDLLTISCSFEIQCKFNQGRTEKASFSSTTQDVENKRSRWEVRLSQFVKNPGELFEKENQIQVYVEITAKYSPKLAADNNLWEVDRIAPVFPPSQAQDTQITSKFDSTVSVQISQAVLKARVKTFKKETTEMVVPIKEIETLVSFKQYLETGHLSTETEHAGLCQLAETAEEFGLEELKKFCLRHLTFTLTDGTVSESIELAKRLKAEPECLEFMYDHALRRFEALRLEAARI